MSYIVIWYCSLLQFEKLVTWQHGHWVKYCRRIILRACKDRILERGRGVDLKASHQCSDGDGGVLCDIDQLSERMGQIDVSGHR